MAGVNIDTNDLVEEIAMLSKNVSMLRLECKARSRHEDELTAQLAKLEAAEPPDSLHWVEPSLSFNSLRAPFAAGARHECMQSDEVDNQWTTTSFRCSGRMLRRRVWPGAGLLS